MATTLLDDITAYVAEYPQASLRDIYDRFGQPMHDGWHLGTYKTYVDAVFQRDGQFVMVQHRDFGNTQIIRVREVTYMEQTTVTVVCVPAGSQGKDDWAHVTDMVPNAAAFMHTMTPRPA